MAHIKSIKKQFHYFRIQSMNIDSSQPTFRSSQKSIFNFNRFNVNFITNAYLFMPKRITDVHFSSFFIRWAGKIWFTIWIWSVLLLRLWLLLLLEKLRVWKMSMSSILSVCVCVYVHHEPLVTFLINQKQFEVDKSRFFCAPFFCTKKGGQSVKNICGICNHWNSSHQKKNDHIKIRGFGLKFHWNLAFFSEFLTLWHKIAFDDTAKNIL